MPDPRLFLDIVGTVSPDTSGGYTRFSLGAVDHFVGVETEQLQLGSNTHVSQHGNAVVPILSRLALSDYPSLPPPVVPDPGPGPRLPTGSQTTPKPAHSIAPVGGGSRPPISGYYLTDGTALSATEDEGIVTQLHGVSEGTDIDLSISISTTKGPGRPGDKVKVTWLGIKLIIKKGLDSPFTFGFNYSAESFLFSVVTTQGNVENSILIDLAPAVVESQSGNVDGVAVLNRRFSYYGDIYSAQGLETPAGVADAQFHLPNQATLWPFMPYISLFSDVFAKLSEGAPATSSSPFIAIGSLNDFVPPPSVDVIREQMVSTIAPAFGPLAASCLSSDDQAAGLKDAALWLGDILLNTANGAAAIGAQAEAYHALQVSAENSDSTGQNRPKIPLMIDTPSDAPPHPKST